MAMNLNTHINLQTNKNTFNTYFIHVKKSDISDLDDLVMIKHLIDEQYNVNSDNTQLSDFKFINKNDLKNKSHKNVGRYLKSNKASQCAKCNETICKEVIFKQLNCGHRFHIECIDPILKKDIYKQCLVCNTENVTCLLY
jgi:hypothetical protein